MKFAHCQIAFAMAAGLMLVTPVFGQKTTLPKKSIRAARVASLTATRCDVVCRLKEVDDFDANPITRKFLACRAPSGNAVVEAVSNPVLTAADLPRVWTLTGGVGTAKLTRTLPLTVEGPTTFVARCVNERRTLVDVRPNLRLQFVDHPRRPKSSTLPLTWDARLNAVSVSAPHSAKFSVLDSITYGFTVSASGAVSVRSATAGSAITITSFGAYDDGVSAGVDITAEYTGCAEDTPQWNQIITTSDPAAPGCTSPYTDPCPNDDSLPYYWTEAELPTYISPVP